MRISDWSSDVCSSDLREQPVDTLEARQFFLRLTRLQASHPASNRAENLSLPRTDAGGSTQARGAATTARTLQPELCSELRGQRRCRSTPGYVLHARRCVQEQCRGAWRSLTCPGPGNTGGPIPSIRITRMRSAERRVGN